LSNRKFKNVTITKLFRKSPSPFPKSRFSFRSSKYLGVIFDDKLVWKSQIENLVTQLSKSSGILYKLKYYTNISLLKSLYFALFHSYLTYSVLNWEEANKIITPSH